MNAAASASAVSVTALRKSFGSGPRRVQALRGVDLRVDPGQIYGFLGPNGAGKTTTLRILTTLLRADSGTATVSGLDVRRQPAEVRRRIGYVGQLGGADLAATGEENLYLQGRLHGLTAAETRRRAAQLSEELDLRGFVGRIVRTCSGGQRRRLEVALGLIHHPEVLFLDEPTLGLDPQNRAHLWDQLRALCGAGTSIVITTHYLDEADQLCDRVAIIDQGRIVAEGTPAELKGRHHAGVTIAIRRVAGDLAVVTSDLANLPSVLGVRIEGDAVRVEVAETTSALAAIFDRLRGHGIEVLRVALSEPSLDDVFLHETGRSLRDAAAANAPGEAAA
jgi:ABC-2 type transport system ATP-binding protein